MAGIAGVNNSDVRFREDERDVGAPPPAATRERSTEALPAQPGLVHDGPWLAPEAFPAPVAVRKDVYTGNSAERPTSLTALDAARDVYPRLLDATPKLSPQACLLLASQYAHETGNGAHCYNFNLGNVKAAPGLREPHMYLNKTWEVVSQKELARLTSESTPFHERVHVLSAAPGGRVSVRLDPPHPGTAFRAYASFDEGFRAWLARFQGYAARSPEFARALNDGDAAAFASHLRNDFHYFTDDAAKYGRGLASHQKRIAGQISG
jgi:hypothetical protein